MKPSNWAFIKVFNTDSVILTCKFATRLRIFWAFLGFKTWSNSFQKRICTGLGTYAFLIESYLMNWPNWINLIATSFSLISIAGTVRSDSVSFTWFNILTINSYAITAIAHTVPKSGPHSLWV